MVLTKKCVSLRAKLCKIISLVDEKDIYNSCNIDNINDAVIV